MAEDRHSTTGRDESGSGESGKDGQLSPVEALALADRARAAARRPAPLPWWYGPGVGVALAAYSAALGQSYQHQLSWLILLYPLALVLLLAPIVRAAVRVDGVARLADRETALHPLRALAALLLPAVVAALGTWFATDDQRWALTAGGIAGGAAYWAVIAVFNRRISERRDADRGKEEQSMSSTR